MGIATDRHCSRGPVCTQYESLGEPAKLSKGNLNGICFASQEADTRYQSCSYFDRRELLKALLPMAPLRSKALDPPLAPERHTPPTHLTARRKMVFALRQLFEMRLETREQLTTQIAEDLYI
jgi:hypothetical protein